MAEAIFEVVGLDKLRTNLRKFIFDLSNLKRPITRAMRWTLIHIKRDARQGKKPGGGAYEPYTADYREWLQSKGLAGGKKWLTLSGKMLGTMKIRTSKRQGALGFLRESKQAKKARTHNFGYAKQGIPQRKFLVWRGTYIRHVRDAIMWQYLKSRAKKHKLRIVDF